MYYVFALMRVWFRIQLLEQERFRELMMRPCWQLKLDYSSSMCLCLCVWPLTKDHVRRLGNIVASGIGIMWIWKRAERSVKYMYMCARCQPLHDCTCLFWSVSSSRVSSPQPPPSSGVGFAMSRLEIAKFWWLANVYLFQGIWSSSRLVGTEVHKAH